MKVVTAHMSNRESVEYDIVIVGGGPAGLSAAIRLKQIDENISVCVLEKGSEIGAHILSGAVIDPKALDELYPDWRESDCPLIPGKVTKNLHWVLTKKRKFALPHLMLPPFLHNKGTYTGSLGNLTRWLGSRAEDLGVEIFPGFAAAEILYRDDGSVKGVATGAMGIARDGTHKDSYEEGLELHGKYVMFAEGARGHLTKQLKKTFSLDADSQPQIYGLGIKEIWDVDPKKHALGTVLHTQGWPLAEGSNGGGFLYHQENNQIALGFVTWLNYDNPSLSPFKEMQRWKHHPEISTLLEGGKRVAYGARAINDGGWQSVPNLAFPGGALIGCSAGFVNVPRIKGTHTAMKTGMMAAEAAAAALKAGREADVLNEYQAAYEDSWVYKELRQVRNVLPAVEKFGDFLGSIFAGMMMWMEYFRIPVPFTMKHHPDYQSLRRTQHYHPIEYPKPDGKISFDLPSSVFLSNTNHEEDQPVHLQLTDPSIPVEQELPIYDGPSQHFCPAGVYEYIEDEAGNPKFQINAQNCVHCKTCDIKDPFQNITWVVPEGGGGPNYPNM
jgi:electron-transferring-flavoprotein dehydrogenase